MAGNVTNLKSWKPGQSGNPGGRRKGGPSLLTELLKDLDKIGDKQTRAKRVTLVASTLVDRAIAGDMGAQQLVWRYVEGNPTQPIEHSGDVGVTVSAVREALQAVS